MRTLAPKVRLFIRRQKRCACVSLGRKNKARRPSMVARVIFVQPPHSGGGSLVFGSASWYFGSPMPAESVVVTMAGALVERVSSGGGGPPTRGLFGDGKDGGLPGLRRAASKIFSKKFIRSLVIGENR